MTANRWLARLAVATIAIFAGNRASAQTAADSAATARAHYRAAVAANGRGQLDSAFVLATQAVSAWPAQSLYPSAVAMLAARRSDTTALVKALDALARDATGGTVPSDSAIRRMAASTAVAAAMARVHVASATLAASRTFATLSDSTVFPEGVDVDATSGRVFVASVRHRNILERSSDGRERWVLPANTPGIGALLAVRFDAKRQVLWATTSGIPQSGVFAPADSAISALLRIRLSDGAIERRWDLPPVPGGRTLGDVAIGPQGDVFVSDSRTPSLYWLRSGADTLQRFTHALFRSLQGVAPAENGFVYVADYSHGLLRVSLESGAVQRVSDSAVATTLGLDGIVLYRGTIIGVQNGVAPPRIVQFTLDRSGKRIVSTRVLDRNLPIADEPTIGTIVGETFVYVANSQWEKYDDDGKRRPGTQLTRPTLLQLPLPAGPARGTMQR